MTASVRARGDSAASLEAQVLKTPWDALFLSEEQLKMSGASENSCL